MSNKYYVDYRDRKFEVVYFNDNGRLVLFTSEYVDDCWRYVADVLMTKV